MIGKILSTLIGEAPQGQRKYIMGMVTVTGLLALLACCVVGVAIGKGDPATLGGMLDQLTDALWLVFGAAAAGLTAEHYTKSKS